MIDCSPGGILSFDLPLQELRLCAFGNRREDRDA